MTTQRVLVTGGSGFIAGHCILQLLEEGYEVRTTARSLSREPKVRQVLRDAGMVNGSALTFVEADLLSDDGWDAAVAGVDFVLHVASPVNPGHVENEDDVIVPAREGTVRVLAAAKAAGVKRVVLTSAFHAVAWGWGRTDHIFTDDDWTRLDGPGTDAYAKSKVLAERAAWELVEGGPMQLATILPVAVMGPIMGTDVSGSNHIVQRMLGGGMPAFPNVWIPIVDVRDVARAHLLAMTTPAAAGQRFLISGDPAMPLKRIGAILRAGLGDRAAKVPTRSIPDVVIRLVGLFNPGMRALAPDLGLARKPSSEKARRILGWSSRPAEESIVATGESMNALQQ